MTDSMGELLAIMARLRGAGGCPWDRAQTFASIARYTIEEAYEVADAIESEDPAHLRSELGDLLFQVVFQSQIASEQGHFDFAAVAASICDKLVRRHPHVFESGVSMTAEEQSAAWEGIKARERRAAGAAGAASRVDEVPRSLPALMRTHKLGARAAHAGFDFTEPGGAAANVAEELAEVLAAAAEGRAELRAARVFEELGDLLFAAANLARKLGVDAEAALRAANAKFERRVRGMESLAAARGLDFASLGLAAQEALWHEAKLAE